MDGSRAFSRDRAPPAETTNDTAARLAGRTARRARHGERRPARGAEATLGSVVRTAVRADHCGPPRPKATKQAASARRRTPLRAARDEDRALAARLLLVLRVGRVGGDGAPPPLGLLVTGHLPGDEVEGLRPVLDHERRRVGLQVPVPLGVVGCTSLRGDERVLAVVLDPHERELADLAGAVPPRRDDDDRHARVLERVGTRPAGALVLGDLLAHPLRGRRLVLPAERHERTSLAVGAAHVRGACTAGMAALAPAPGLLERVPARTRTLPTGARR